MPRRQRRSTLAAAQVGAAGIWQVWASDGPRYLQRPLPCGSTWMQAGQGPGSLRGAGRERRRRALDTPATLSRSRTWARGGCSSGAGPGRPRQLPACQGRSRRGGALQWRPQTHSSPAGCAPPTAHSPPARWVPMSLKPAIYDFLREPACGTGGFLAETFAHLEPQAKTVEENRLLQERTIVGIEAKPLPYLLAQMNLVLHGLE